MVQLCDLSILYTPRTYDILSAPAWLSMAWEIVQWNNYCYSYPYSRAFFGPCQLFVNLFIRLLLKSLYALIRAVRCAFIDDDNDVR